MFFLRAKKTKHIPSFFNFLICFLVFLFQADFLTKSQKQLCTGASIRGWDGDWYLSGAPNIDRFILDISLRSSREGHFFFREGHL